MKNIFKIPVVIALFLALGCEETCCQIEYTQLATGDQVPYLLPKYEFKNNKVLTVEKTEYNSYRDTTKLNRYATSSYIFKNGYLENFREEKLNGGRYQMMETSSIWDSENRLPQVYTYHRNGTVQYKDSLIYDNQDRMIKAYSLSGELDHVYDEDNKLIEKSYSRDGNKEWTTKYVYDGRELEREEFYMHKTGEPVMSLMSRFRESETTQYNIKNGNEELNKTITKNKQGDPLKTSGKYGVTRDLSYEYDERGNWVLRADRTKRGQWYVTHRVITYEDGKVTGVEWNPVKIAAKFGLTYDQAAYDIYRQKLESNRPKQ